MTEQLVFELATPELPSFDSFLPGRNAEALATVKSLASGRLAETCVFIWGAPGAGKTHLLRAAVGAVEARGATAAYCAEPGELHAHEIEWLATQSVVAVDSIDGATPDTQALLFTLFNGLRECAGHLVVASHVAPALLPLRDDLRTRLGWGLVYEIAALADADKPAALTGYARQRGFRLTTEVIEYLLAHGRRDMPALLHVLAALDRHSLATKRAITVPMLRTWLQQEIGLDR